MATFDPNRIGPGTFELVRDPNTGNYSINEVGFTKISPLNLPDLDTTAATTTATQTQTATDVTGDTVSQQTKMAFNMPDTGGDNQPDTTGSMLQQARQTSNMLSDTFADTRQRMTTDDAYRGVTSPLEIKDPTATVFGRPNMRDVAGDVQRDKPTLELEQPTVRTDPVGLSARGTIDRRPQTEFTRPNMRDVAGDAIPMTQKESQLGVDTSRFKGATAGTLADPAEKQDVKPEVKRSALETVSTSLRTTGDSILSKIKTPMMMALDVIATPRNETEAAVDFNQKYFNVRDDGRIAGNPSTDLFAGMNRVSAFGNLNQAGAKRINTREKTIAKKGYKPGDKFYDDTQNMKDQHRDYLESKAKDRDDRMGNTTTNVTGFGKSGFGRDPDDVTGGSDGSGSRGKIVCTMMNESYGFGSFRNKIWMKFHGNIAPEYQKGYHKLFLPLVNYAKQKGITNKIIKNVLEHIAVHSTIDMRQTLRGKRHTLGRLYRKVILPLCYWVGKI